MGSEARSAAISSPPQTQESSVSFSSPPFGIDTPPAFTHSANDKSISDLLLTYLSGFSGRWLNQTPMTFRL